jgi:hypothetical protein
MKKLLRKIGFVAASFMASIGIASAAVPTEVSTALGDLKADVTTIAGLAFAAFLVIVLFNYMRKATH